ncbi:MAG: hypothetical protein N2512_11970 [Armatimonadetes bacterium]|nr:hypothetical protein [Armatimonadota bacterium]
MPDDEVKLRDRQQHARTGLLASFLMVAGSGYFELLTGLVRSVLVMRLLGPTGVGLVGIILLLERYLSNVHFGALHGISKLLPRAIAAEDEARAQQIENTGATWVMATATLGAAGVVVGALLWPGLALPTRLVLGLGAAVFLCDQAYNLYRVVGRSWQVYTPLVVGSVVWTCSLTVLMVVGAWAAGPVGAAMGWLVASSVSAYALHASVRLQPKMSMHWPALRSLLLAGLPLTAMAFADTLLLTLDATILLRHGATVFGLYSGIAIQARRYIFNLVRSLSFVLMPHLLEEYGRHRCNKRLRAAALEPTIALAIGVPLLAAVTAVLLPPAARTLVPKFSAGVPAGQIAAFGTCLMTLPLALSICLVVLNREWEAVAGQVAGAAAIALCVWGPASRGDLTVTAIAAAFGCWVTTIAIGINALARLGEPVLKAVLTLATLHLPLAWTLAAWQVAHRLAEYSLHLHADTWAGALVRLGIMSICLSPLVAYAAKRFDVRGRTRRALTALRKPAVGESNE